MTRTIHVEPESEQEALSEIRDTVSALTKQGKRVAVTVSDEEELLSPQQAAVRLGFSRQHVRRLIEAGLLEATQLPNSAYWRIPLQSVLRFEEQRESAHRGIDEWSRELDELGAPAE